MKKSILALGAAVAVGGFGFAGAAHAVAYFGVGVKNPTTIPDATTVRLNPGFAGHMLYAPYFTTQAANTTLLNIANTDLTNGKVVKVRFRGAANSDDLLDFTLFLSPGDVWTASLARNADSGYSTITTSDKSCTLPTSFGDGIDFIPGRLPPYVSDALRQAGTREGYVEILNMADIKPDTTKGSLYHSIKHSNGVPNNCEATIVTDTMVNTTVLTNSTAAEAMGLLAPTGQLTGSWVVLNQEQLAVYGGAMTAIQAVDVNGANAAGNIIFSPQRGDAIAGAVNVHHQSGDPLLRNGKLEALWYDLPDMSTPLVSTYDSKPHEQVEALANAMARKRMVNDYVNDPNGLVPMLTDWVVAQPTRRYYAAVDYATAANGTDGAKIYWNNDMTAASAATYVVVDTAPATNRYKVLTKEVRNGYPFACLTVGTSTADREENFSSAIASFSPGTTSKVCGEVFTMSFGGSSVLNATVSNTHLTAKGATGWAQVSLTGGSDALPIVGFAATSMKNQVTNVNYGVTLPYRWND